MRTKRPFLNVLQAGHLGSASLIALATMAGTMSGAVAQAPFFYREPAYGYYQDGPYRPEVRRPEGRRPELRPESRRAAPGRPPQRPVKNAEKVKEAPPPPGPHMLIVSVKSQHVSFYANGKLVSQAPVSTGKASNPTPYGVFSVIQRNRHHRSNIYSGAPMPYMQRLTWSGIALHQGALPGYAASHGCIRLPEQYANYLWRTIKMNTRVIVSREDVAPVDVAHPLLFQPKPAGASAEAVPELRKTFDTKAERVRIASAAGTGFADEASAVMRDVNSSVQPAAETATPSPVTEPSAKPAKPDDAPEATASIYPKAADIPEPILTSFGESLDAKHKKAAPAGNVTVFISRKEKRLYVRQHFIPLFSAPVTFKDDKANFGTHVFTAIARDGTDQQLRWTVVTMPAELPQAEKPKMRVELDRHGRRIEVPVKRQVRTPEPVPSLSATAVLDRIEIAPDVIERISEYVAPGASLIVSDHGVGNETGLYTDFIVVTR